MKPFVNLILILLISISVSPVFANNPAESTDKLYPNRKFYPQLNYLSTAQMVDAVKSGKYNIVDARPGTVFKNLHIKGAYNIHSGDKAFTEKFMRLVNANNKPFIFYCGGLTCLKSYKASDKAIQELQKNNIKRDVLTYDSGINAFAFASPESVLKNGQPVSDDNPLLNKKALKKHAKSPEEYLDMITHDEDGQYVILDIREKTQRMLRKLFMFKKENKITVLEPEKMASFFNEVKASGKTLMVYGSVETQIESIYHMIKTAGIKKWFYLEGGEFAYSQYMIKSHVN